MFTPFLSHAMWSAQLGRSPKWSRPGVIAVNKRSIKTCDVKTLCGIYQHGPAKVKWSAIKRYYVQLRVVHINNAIHQMRGTIYEGYCVSVICRAIIHTEHVPISTIIYFIHYNFARPAWQSCRLPIFGYDTLGPFAYHLPSTRFTWSRWSCSQYVYKLAIIIIYITMITSSLAQTVIVYVMGQ